jgi:short-subunit dehydrogenase
MGLSQYVLITGAGSDLGKALALRFAREGYHLVLTDHEATKLLQLEAEVSNLYPSTIVVVIPKDLSSPSAAEELHEEVKEEGIMVNVLVNLPPASEPGYFVETNWTDDEQLLNMLHTLTYLTKIFLREMLLRNNGKILQVICTSSFILSSRRAVFGAMQSYILFFAEALQHELADKDVTLSIMSQGISERDAPPADNVIPTSNDVRMIEVDEIASLGYDAIVTGKKHVIAGFKEDQVGIDQLIPDSWSIAILNKMKEDRS